MLVCFGSLFGVSVLILNESFMQVRQNRIIGNQLNESITIVTTSQYLHAYMLDPLLGWRWLSELVL